MYVYSIQVQVQWLTQTYQGDIMFSKWGELAVVQGYSNHQRPSLESVVVNGGISSTKNCCIDIKQLVSSLYNNQVLFWIILDFLRKYIQDITSRTIYACTWCNVAAYYIHTLQFLLEPPTTHCYMWLLLTLTSALFRYFNMIRFSQYAKVIDFSHIYDWLAVVPFYFKNFYLLLHNIIFNFL